MPAVSTALNLTVTSPQKKLDVYHDIYDFSLFPVSLGDILTWGVKSALRASAAGRDKVHIHLIVDPQRSGFSPLQASSYLVELFVAEAVPIFYSHPLFSGLSIYRTREDFRETFEKLAAGDEISLNLFREHEGIFEDRKNYDRLGRYFKTRCSYHTEINQCFEETGKFPKVGFLGDCLVDWHALQEQFAEETFWVTVQFRLRKLDSGMPVSEEGLHRDAPFLTWYRFIREAQMRHPSVRFVILGRMQEKPLELLRLPNVVMLRALGMNIGHEITALLHSDLYMGSPSGFAQAAHFSDVPYDVFNCTAGGCENYGVPFGATHLPIANSRQRLHYGVEETENLFECLDRALQEGRKNVALPDKLEMSRVSSTDRFFIHDSQSEAELATIFTTRLKIVAFAVENGNLKDARRELNEMAEAFPDFVTKWPDYKWLVGAVDLLLSETETADLPPDRIRARRALLTDVSRYCHPNRLIRRSGRYFDNLFSFEGFENHGWCQRRTKIRLAPSDKGDVLMLQVGRLGGEDPVRLKVTINDQKPHRFVLLNEYAMLEVPISEASVPTEILLEADRSWRRGSRDENEQSFQLEGAALISRQMPMPSFYRGDKRDPRDKVVSGIHTNGAASSVARVRIDNPFPAGRDILVQIIGAVPRSLRKGQTFRIQVNDGPAYETLIRGKYFEALVPCPGQPRHVSILMEFWEQNEEEQARENRMLLQTVKIVPGSATKPDFRTGLRALGSYLLRRKSK